MYANFWLLWFPTFVQISSRVTLDFLHGLRTADQAQSIYEEGMRFCNAHLLLATKSFEQLNNKVLFLWLSCYHGLHCQSWYFKFLDCTNYVCKGVENYISSFARSCMCLGFKIRIETCTRCSLSHVKKCLQTVRLLVTCATKCFIIVPGCTYLLTWWGYLSIAIAS